MLVPYHWRLQKERYALEGQQCPVCGAQMLAKRPICPSCGASTSENIVDKKEALGVGALLFVLDQDKDAPLKLLLFKQISNGPQDRDSQKQERIVGADDRFSIPAGFNTVTGRVDQPEAVELFTARTELTELNPALRASLLKSIQREISEEAGLEVSAEQIPYLSLSSIIIEQIRPIEAESEQKELITFTVFVLAAVLNASDLEGVERPYQLFDVAELSQLERRELRKATLATLDFLQPALLFLAQNGQIEENLIPAAVLNQQN